ncbi:MAG: hypothetical protein ACAH83_17430 [Alphaproteobacteria bacterium]
MKETAVTPIAELSGIFKKYPYPLPLISALDMAIKQADTGTDNDKFALGRLMTDFLDTFARETGVRPAPDDEVRAKKLLLQYFETLAENGHVMAMRFAACGYANGDCLRKVSKTKTGYTVSAAPDFSKACAWARKAEAAGDWVAAKIRPDFERRLAEEIATAPPLRLKMKK